jgi:hypothetical protein
MSAIADDPSKEYLVQQVAKRLSPELRAEYYRILRYCRSLPESDELLIVLNAIQLLFSLVIDVPSQIASEGQKIERFLEPAVKAQEHTVHLLEQYQTQWDQRLAQVPEEIAKRLQPERIASQITQSLRQQFADTTIPETAKLLKGELKEVCTAVGEFKGAAGSIIHDCHGAAADTRRATQQLQAEATGLARFHWSFAYYLAGLALMIGMILGALVYWSFAPSSAPCAQPAQAKVQQSALPVVQKSRPNSRH